MFSFHTRTRLPSTPKAWKRFLKKKGTIRDQVDIYNANPIRDWKTKHEEKLEAAAKVEKDRKDHIAWQKMRADEAANPVVEVLDIVCIKDRHTSLPYDGLNQSAWFLVKVNYKLRLYNTTSLRVVEPPPPPPIPKYAWDNPPLPPLNPYGLLVESRCKLSDIVKRRLNAAIKKFLK